MLPKGSRIGNSFPIGGGKKGLGTDTMPPVNLPAGNTIRYHIRSGGHAVTLYDWQQYLEFADMQLK